MHGISSAMGVVGNSRLVCHLFSCPIFQDACKQKLTLVASRIVPVGLVCAHLRVVAKCRLLLNRVFLLFSFGQRLGSRGNRDVQPGGRKHKAVVLLVGHSSSTAGCLRRECSRANREAWVQLDALSSLYSLSVWVNSMLGCTPVWNSTVVACRQVRLVLCRN